MKKFRSCHSNAEPDKIQKPSRAHPEKPTKSSTFVNRWVETIDDNQTSNQIHPDIFSTPPVLLTRRSKRKIESAASSEDHTWRSIIQLLGIVPLPLSFDKDNVPDWVLEIVGKVQAPRPRNAALADSLTRRFENVYKIFLGTGGISGFAVLDVLMTALELNLYHNLDVAPQIDTSPTGSWTTSSATDAQQDTSPDSIHQDPLQEQGDEEVQTILDRNPHVAKYHILQ